MLSAFIQLTTEKTLQEMLELEQSEHLNRERYERGESPAALHRNGYEPGTLKSAEGVLQVMCPPIRGGEAPYRSRPWPMASTTSESLWDLVVEM